MYRLTRFSAPAMVAGVFLTSSTFGQVIEERPATQTGQQVPENTAILTDADRTDADRDSAGLRRVSNILSGEARGPGDEGRIAAISDIIMDGEGRPHYILLSRGGLAGLGGDKIAVPFGVGSLMQEDGNNWNLQLNMTGDQLDQAPTLEDGSLAPLRDANWLQANRQFFQADAAGDEAGTGDDSFLFRASALKDAQVHGAAGDESIANVDDVLLGGDYRATYAILGYGGVAGVGKNQVPVPFSMINLSSERDDDRYRLVVRTDLTKDRLQSDTAPQLDGNDERMLDSTFLERVNTYFGTDHQTGVVPTPAATVEPGTQP